MGLPKHELIQIDSGLTLLQDQLQRLTPQFQETLLLVGEKRLEADQLPTQVLDPEGFSGQGPLAGLLSACKASPSEYVALLACDYPQVTSEVFRVAKDLMGPEDKALVFEDGGGRAQWLCGIYRADLASDIGEFLRRGGRAVKCFAKHLALVPVACPAQLDPSQFTNLNTLDEARQAGFIPASGGTIVDPAESNPKTLLKS